jgi:hypothetical protein
MGKQAANIVGGILLALFALAASFYLEGWAHSHSPLVFRMMMFSGVGALICYGSLFFIREPVSNRPQLVLGFTMQTGFTLQNVGGDAVRDIQVGPIQSVRKPSFRIGFDGIPALTSTDGIKEVPFWWFHGEDRQLPRWTTTQLSDIFFKREDPERDSINYRVVLRFLWHSKRTEDIFTLTWDKSRSRITITPLE